MVDQSHPSNRRDPDSDPIYDFFLGVPILYTWSGNYSSRVGLRTTSPGSRPPVGNRDLNRSLRLRVDRLLRGLLSVSDSTGTSHSTRPLRPSTTTSRPSRSPSHPPVPPLSLFSSSHPQYHRLLSYLLRSPVPTGDRNSFHKSGERKYPDSTSYPLLLFTLHRGRSPSPVHSTGMTGES